MRYRKVADVDGSLWTEVVDHRQKLIQMLPTTPAPFGLTNHPFLIEIDLMELKMKSKYAKEYLNLKKMDITVFTNSLIYAKACETLRYVQSTKFKHN